jgi:hypothetical protein
LQSSCAAGQSAVACGALDIYKRYQVGKVHLVLHLVVDQHLIMENLGHENVNGPVPNLLEYVEILKF